MAPDTRTDREARHDATEPATSAGSHDTVGRTTTSFGPPKENTFASAWSDVSGISYISPANVGFDPASPIAPCERPMAPTPGPIISPSPRLSPAPVNTNILLSDLLPSDAPSSCDFGTPKNFAHTPIFGPSPPFVPKTRGRAAFQARCETASPSSDTLSRFLKDFTIDDLCDPAAPQEDAAPVAPTTKSPTTEQVYVSETLPTEQAYGNEPATTEQACASEPATNDQAYSSEPATNDQAYASGPATNDQAYASEPAAAEQAHLDAFTNWSLYAVPGNLLADFVSGILKFSELDKDGNPVFVKDTDTNTSSQQQSSNGHKDVNAVHVSQEENRIFVSMDQLRKEIAELQEHDEAMQREADKAHQEKSSLELQLQEVRGTCRKASSDSAIGSDSDDDIRKRTQAEKIKRMQKRLDEANNLANSQNVHIDALTTERDELIKECHLAHEYKKVLSEQNQVLSKQNEALNKENQNIKSLNMKAGNSFLSIENEFKQLNSENERLRQQLSQMYQQNDSLRKTRKTHSEQIKNLQSELEATRGQLDEATQDIKGLVRKNEKIKAQSEQIKNLQSELEATRGQLGEATQDIKVLVRKNKEIKAHSEQFENLQSELEATRGQLGEATQDIKILVRKNKEIKAHSEHMDTLNIEIEDTYNQLVEINEALKRENKEVKAQRDKIEGSYESLQENYTVIRRKLRERDESTVNSVSSTGSEARTRRRTPSIQIRRTAAATPQPNASSTTPAAYTAPVARTAPASRTAAATTQPNASTTPAVRYATATGDAPDSDNEDHTIRPVNEPLDNIRMMISRSESELAMLQRKYEKTNEEYKALNKGYDFRLREKLHKHIVALQKAMNDKNNIIYQQYDIMLGIGKGGKA